ncbi:hypothetical protein Lesp02_85400 [Lentzea sp. NBRC 105346]|nr:hypothetical protein Lesp02_85400 [Lentzea sp. NBRC 105346]
MIGLDSTDATLIRLGENALYRLTRPIVVRIARTMDYFADVCNEVSVAQWLASENFPAAQVTEHKQPIVVDNHPVTFWRFIPGRPGNNSDIAALGKILRRLHDLPKPTSFTLPTENILDRVEPRITTAAVPFEDKEFLLNRLAELRVEVARLQYPLAPAATHGDAHTENLVMSDGQPILIDFERFSWGQPEWDLAMTATEYRTAGWWSQDEYALFTDSYGYDVTSWSDGFPVLQAVHELKMTTWLMQNIGESQIIADEFQARMRTLRTGQRGQEPWRPF